MLRRVNFYTICFAVGLSIFLILAVRQYARSPYYRSSLERWGNFETFSKVEDGEEKFPQLTSSGSYNEVTNIDKILEKTRSKIKFELSNYNFSYSGVHNLNDLLMESGGRPIRNIIVSTWRSGTSFLGEVLNAVPGTFYHYEPFLKYGIKQIKGPPDTIKALNSIRNMLNCNFKEMDDYFEFGKSLYYQFSHNTRLWDHCKDKKELCYDADFTSRFCKLFPFQSMKLVHLRLRFIQELLEDEELNVKMILMVRDPRGVLQSRQHRSLCQWAPDYWQPERLCSDMISDYVAASRLLPQYPNRLMIIRYEELALKPNETTHQIYKFLRLGATQSLDEFLQSHTNVEVSGFSSTFKVSSDVPFKWKYAMDFEYVNEIQPACKDAMDMWGYRMAHNATHMASKKFNPIDNYTIKQRTNRHL